MDSIYEIKNAQIYTRGKISGATYYHVFPETIYTVNQFGERRVYNKPHASFHNGENKHLGNIEFETWNNTQENILNNMIDPKAQQKKPIKAAIGYDMKSGRTLYYFFDENADLDKPDELDEKNFIEHGYSGPIDIKGSKHLDLIKPHSMLSDIKKVTEDGYFISPLLFPYHKKTLIYENDVPREETTPQHKLIQAGKITLGLGLLYGAYSLISNLIGYKLNS
jgi:hypothetical protein